MKEHICSLEFLLNIMRGYYHIIDPEKRPTLTLSDGCGDSKTTQIKSIVAVDENCGEREAMTRLKCIDVDDVMWDIEEYMTTDDIRTLCKAIKLPDDIELPF